MPEEYSEEESKLFSGRKYYLNLLKNNKESIKKGIGKNIILLGQKGIGKSHILKEFVRQTKDIEFAVIDLEKASISPESLAVEFIGNFLFYMIKGKAGDYAKFSDISFLSELSLPKKSREFIKDIKNELEKIKPDQNLLLQRAFSFPAVYADETGKKAIVCIKELQDLELLNNYEQIKNVIALFEKSIAGASIIATASDSAFCSKLSEFSIETVNYLDENETAELAAKLTSKKVDSALLYKLTLGHPYYIKAVCNALEKTSDLKKAFVQQILSKEGRINIRCRELLDHYLSKARGKSLLFILLKVLSYSPARLNEIAKKIYRSSPVTKSLLSRLIDVEIISLKNNIFSYNDPILKQFVNLTIARNIEFDEEVSEQMAEKLKEELK